MTATTEIWCCACETTVQAIPATGADVYPHRPEFADRPFYRCPACSNYVGCHHHRRVPLGCIPTPELRRARQHIHAVIDPLWQPNNRAARGAIYAILSERIGRQYHTAEIKTLEEAREIYLAAKRIAASWQNNAARALGDVP